MDNGWIKMHRKLLDWEWFDNPSVLKLWLWLLFSANHDDKRWQGKVIKRGQRLTSIRHICESLRMGHETVMKSLDRLKSTGEISIQSDKKYGSLITIVKYNDYQLNEEFSVSETGTPTGTQVGTPTGTQVGTPTGTKQEYKEDKNINYLSVYGGTDEKKEDSFDRQAVLESYRTDEDWVNETSGWLRVPADEVRQCVSDFSTQIKQEKDESDTDERELSRHLFNFIRNYKRHKDTGGRENGKSRTVYGSENEALKRMQEELDRAIAAS